jgi:hypothetical protein
MLDGCNEGWIDFERGKSGTPKGEVELEVVLKELVALISRVLRLVQSCKLWGARC